MKPRIKRSRHCIIPLSGTVVFGAYWACNGATGMTPALAYMAWQLEWERRQRVAPPPAAEVAWWRRTIEWIEV